MNFASTVGGRNSLHSCRGASQEPCSLQATRHRCLKKQRPTLPKEAFWIVKRTPLDADEIMVRVVGGTIHNVVPATAKITQHIRPSDGLTIDHASSSDTPVASSLSSSKAFSKHGQSLPTLFSPVAAKHGLPSNGTTRLDDMTNGNGPRLPGIDPDLKFGAKPSEIRAAAKQNRGKARLEQIRKDKVRQREAEAALRMKKIKDEIDNIKAHEHVLDQEAVADVVRERCNFTAAQAAATALESSGGPSPPGFMKQTAVSASGRARETRTPRAPAAPERKLSKAEADEAVSRGNKELALEEMMVEQSSARQKKDEDEKRARVMSSKALNEMSASFHGADMPKDELDHFRERMANDVPCSTAAVAASSPPPSQQQLEPTRSGKLHKAPSRRRVTRTPSSLVPEMRRRANQRDLLYDDDDKDNNDRITAGQHDDLKGLAPDAGKAESVTEPPSQAVGEKKDNPATLTTASTSQATATVERASETKPKSSMIAAREARDAAKVGEERRIKKEQRAELDKAKEHFDKGHDLCWKGSNSAAALVEYRKALFVRESVLGKYHEETGRSYFWIGKSLSKLRDYDEALMAYSRALRIFRRVLHQSNKYNIWSVTAVESVFRQMDDPSSDFPSYKASLEASIRHEQDGDQLRKKGKLAEAIAEYREAIDNLEEYHPDAADLYCKIAIMMRQQGEFDRALEEYRYASEIYELSLGAEHPETVKTLNQLIEKKRLNQKALALMEKLTLRKGP